MSSKWDERLKMAQRAGQLSLEDRIALDNFNSCLVGEGLREAEVEFDSRGSYILVNGEREEQLSALGLGFSANTPQETIKHMLTDGIDAPIMTWADTNNIKKIKAQKARIDRYIREHYPKQVWEPEPPIEIDFTPVKQQEGQKEEKKELTNA